MDILLYNTIYSYTAAEFIRRMDEEIALGTDEIVCRINGDGGDPQYGFGIISKWQQYQGAKKIQVDGKAYSMYAFMLCYATNVTCLDVSDFIIHRAAYPRWFESDPELFTPDARAFLNTINKQLRTALEARIDVAKFESTKGVTIKQLFSLDDRVDVRLTAAEAKSIGLVDKIEKITPVKKQEINALDVKMAAQYKLPPVAAFAGDDDNNDTPIAPIPPKKVPTTSKNMTLTEFKTAHPEIYAQAIAEGVAAERDRVSAWMVFAPIDLPAATKGITEGKNVTMAITAEFSLKSVSAAAVKDLEEQNAGEVTTKAENEDPGKGGAKPNAELAAMKKRFEEKYLPKVKTQYNPLNY